MARPAFRRGTTHLSGVATMLRGYDTPERRGDDALSACCSDSAAGMRAGSR